jgi:glutathione peroxidase
MKRFNPTGLLGIAMLSLTACNKSPAPTATAIAPAKTTEAATPTIPAAGTAPAPVAIPKEGNAMWTTAIKNLSGTPTSLAAYDGKALLIVNVASKCGLTPQYADLEAIQKKYQDKGFTVIGFPCNQFGGQEPGSAEQIATFCSTTYGVTFPMMEKIEVNGAGRHPIYQTLTEVADAKGYKGDIRWNFEKYVVSADRTKITRFDPQVTPTDPTVVASIEASLPNK